MIYDFNSVKQVAQYFTVVFVAIVPFDMWENYLVVSVHKPDTNKQYYGGVFFFYHFFFQSDMGIIFHSFSSCLRSLLELQNHALGSCQMELNFGCLNLFTLS